MRFQNQILQVEIEMNFIIWRVPLKPCLSQVPVIKRWLLRFDMETALDE